MTNPKIFVGPGNTAGNAKFIAFALRTAGLYAKSFSYRVHPFGYECDYDGILIRFDKNRSIVEKIFKNKYTLKFLNSSQKYFLFLKAIFKFNVFFFISPVTFFPNHRDLKILKIFNKKIFFLFPGCFERNPNDEINQSKSGFCKGCTDFKKQKICCCNEPKAKGLQIKIFEKYSNGIIAQRDTYGYLSQPEKYIKGYVIAEEPENIRVRTLNQQKVIIGHFPSNTILKGTSFVDEAIKQLGDSNIEYVSEKMNHSDILKKLDSIDILIDQFGSGHGLLAIEAMARGCLVICRLSDWYLLDYPEIPIINSDQYTISDKIKDLTSNPEKFASLSSSGIKYYKKFHSPKVVGEYFKKIILKV